jgi:hypothetical protein
MLYVLQIESSILLPLLKFSSLKIIIEPVSYIFVHIFQKRLLLSLLWLLSFWVSVQGLCIRVSAVSLLISPHNFSLRRTNPSIYYLFLCVNQLGQIVSYLTYNHRCDHHQTHHYWHCCCYCYCYYYYYCYCYCYWGKAMTSS